MIHEFIAGTVGGIAQVVVGYPMDTVKVRMQTAGLDRSAWQWFTHLVQHESWTSLYRGMASPMAGIGFCNALVFAANASFSRTFGEEHVIAAGACAGATVAFLNTPIELLKIRCQADSVRYKGITDCARQTVQTSGIQGLYRGLFWTLLRDIPSFASYFWAYQWLKQRLTSNESGTIGTLGLLAAGGAAGIAAWLPCYPQDMIKSRLQRDDALTLRQVVVDIYKQNGWRAFYRGLSPALVRAVPANAVTFLAYEWTMQYLKID